MHNASRVIQHFIMWAALSDRGRVGVYKVERTTIASVVIIQFHKQPPNPSHAPRGVVLVWDSASYTDKGKSEGGYALSLAGLVVLLARIIRICIIPAINRAAITRAATCANKP